MAVHGYQITAITLIYSQIYLVSMHCATLHWTICPPTGGLLERLTRGLNSSFAPK